MFERIASSVRERPVVWLLSGILAITAYSHYQTSRELSEVCSVSATLYGDYVDLEDLQNLEDYLKKKAQRGLDSISQKVEKHQRLMSEDTREGREYRWRFRAFRELEKKCGREFPFTGESR